MVGLASSSRTHLTSASEENILLSVLPPRRADARKTLPISPRKGSVQPVYSSGAQSASPVASDVRGRGKTRQHASASPPNRSLKSPTSPDRFIPIRDFDDSPSTPFHVNKSTQQLTPEEKLLRQRSPKADPFMPARPQRLASVPPPQAGRRLSPHYAPHMVTESAVTGAHTANGPRDIIRQISSGAVWHVGGAATAQDRPPLPIPDGAGGLLGSGTTAPMYTARFPPQTTTTEQREQHEARVALALDIDPASRLLTTSRPWPLHESRPSPSSPDFDRLSPLEWKDSAWKRADGNQGECTCRSIIATKSWIHEHISKSIISYLTAPHFQLIYDTL